ncbi:MAG: hypothetical protein NVSMB46_02510 [Candidatus Saccharimonadales bacterium]
MSLADGFAAIFGLHYGKNNSYKVFKHTKSIIGSNVFFVISLLITIVVIILLPTHVRAVSYVFIVLIPIITTLIENVSPFGSDNIFVPLFFLVSFRLLLL